LNVMRIADSDPTGWRDRFRADKVWNNAAALKKAAAEASIEEIAAQPTPFLLTIEVQLRRLGQDSIPFMTRVQEMHPADFWANVTMGFLRWKMKPELPEAIRYYQTAVALRPDAASIHYQLGSVLWEVGRNDEAIVQYRLSLQLDPGYTFAHGALGVALAHLKDYDHSVIELREAMRENPTDIGLYGILGDVFTLAGRDPDALEQYRKGAELRPKLLAAQRGIRATLCREGRPAEEVFAAWKTAIDANPNDQEAVEGYAEYCLYAGQADKYPEACRNLLDRFGKITDPRVCERMGRACLLAACSPSQLSEATALVDRAVASEENHKTIYASFFQFAKALAEYRAGDMDAVCTRIDGKVLGVLGPAPRLVLAMAQFRLGNVDEAKKNLAQAIRRIDWSPKRAQYAEDWMNHILRREAEEMILSNGE
jgi:tetratricopeptide (TPR) repeat protein